MAEVEGVGVDGGVAESSAPGGLLGKNEFLTLLITQLRYQDPMKPMDSSTMIAELAQFSALEQMQNMNEQLAGARREDSLIQSMLLEGETIQVELTDGTQAVGIVDKVAWEDGGIALYIDGMSYPMSRIVSISKTVPLGV